MAIWPETEAAVTLFLFCQTQWRRVLAGTRLVPLGLDYAAVRAAAEMSGAAMTPELFTDLRVMEAAALAAMTEDGAS